MDRLVISLDLFEASVKLNLHMVDLLERLLTKHGENKGDMRTNITTMRDNFEIQVEAIKVLRGATDVYNQDGNL